MVIADSLKNMFFACAKASAAFCERLFSIKTFFKYVRNEDAEEIINEAIENGYKKAQELMNELLKASDDESTDIDFITDDDLSGIY